MPVKVMRLEGERFELALRIWLFPKALKSIPPPAGAPVRCGPAPARWPRTGRRGCAARRPTARLRQALCRGCRRARRRHHLRGAAATPWPTRRPSRGRAHGGLPRGGCNQLYPAEKCGALPAHRGGRRRGGLRARMGLPAPAPHLPRPQPAHCGLSRATLIVEAGQPPGTFTADEARLRAGRYGWCRGHHLCGVEGANRLLYQGAPSLWTTKPSPARSSQPSVV